MERGSGRKYKWIKDDIGVGKRRNHGHRLAVFGMEDHEGSLVILGLSSAGSPSEVYRGYLVVLGLRRPLGDRCGRGKATEPWPIAETFCGRDSLPHF